MSCRRFVKKAVITIVANVPRLKSLKEDWRAALRRWLRIPHQEGFKCISFLNPTKDSLFLDVGANCGQSIDSIRLFAPQSQVVSFEPNPMMVTLLREKFHLDPNFRVECLAAGAHPGEFDLYVPSYRGQYFPDLASLDGAAVARWLPARIWRFRPEWHHVEKVKCRVCRLDDLKLEPFLIKIDVCCLQTSVIRGALGTIEACKPFLIPTNTSDMGQFHDLLAPFGYHAFVYDNGRLRRAPRDAGSACLIADEKKAKMPARFFAS